MRRILLTYILLVVGLLTAQAQFNPTQQVDPRTGRDANGNQIDPAMRVHEDSTDVEIQGLPPKLYMWHVSENLGTIQKIPADTATHMFQNTNLVEGLRGHYNYLGNLGSPRLSRLFFERHDAEPTIFMEPFSSFFIRPDEFNFTNSNVPFTNLSYYKAGNKVNGEERFKSYFSVNVNKQLAFGFNFDYLYGRGYYNNQNTSFFNAALFGSYIGDRYEATLLYSNNYLKMNENGGITDDRYITRPEEMAEGKKEYESQNIPTLLSKSANRNKDFYIFLTQRYKLGFTREVAKAKDDTTSTEKTEFVPVTSFIHTMKVERARHQFTSEDELYKIYPEAYIQPGNKLVNDSTSYIGVKNTLGIALLEGFNKYAKAGLTTFISHKLSNYRLMDRDSVSVDKYSEHEVFVGGELAKRQGKTLHYRAMGEVGILDKAIGQFRVNADLDLNFRLWKDTVSFIARGSISNTLPAFYMRHYHSKYFYWDNDNMFHLDNEVTWQKSSNTTVLPLPELSLYHNFYIQTTLAKKVLHVQLGADVRYFTKYYAPAYTPAIQQFHLQPEDDQVKIGGYPIINVYANLQLKRTRLFAMMYHVNQGMGNSNYFLSPHYPINPRLFKIGVSWNFYD